MTVKELINHLETLPQEYEVVYDRYSERVLLEKDEIEIITASLPRNDGWVHDARPDKSKQKYVSFPGN